MLVFKDTNLFTEIQNLVKVFLAVFENVKSVNCKVKLDKQVNNVIIDLNLVVSPETIIKELSTNIQNRIKEIIKTTTEIEVKEINITPKSRASIYTITGKKTSCTACPITMRCSCPQ